MCVSVFGFSSFCVCVTLQRVDECGFLTTDFFFFFFACA